MAKVIPLQHAVKVFFIAIVALVVMLGGSELSDRLVSNASNAGLVRWFGVAIAMLALVPWVVLMVWGIGLGDEFVRRVALVGTALAFVGQFLIHVGIVVARDAALVRTNFDLPPLPLASGLWMVGVAIAALYYRFRL